MGRIAVDIAILGAGISGLLIGSELAKSHNVVLIDKKNAFYSEKFWVTQSGISNAEYFSPFHECQFSFMDMVSYDEYARRCFGRYILWDGEGIEEHLEESIAKAGGTIIKNNNVYSVKESRDCKVVITEDYEVQCRLVVDCMGFSSPFAIGFGATNIFGYYGLVGGIYRLKRDIPPICFHNVNFEKKARFLEIFPRKNGTAYVVLIASAAEIPDMSCLFGDFHNILRRTKYKHYIDPEEIGRMHGIVPVGRARHKALDNLFFYGESGRMNPSATGTCLTVLFKNYRDVARNLSDALRDGDLTGKRLSKVPLGITPFNVSLQNALFGHALKWGSRDVSRFLRGLEGIDDGVLNDILFAEADVKKPGFLRAASKLLIRRHPIAAAAIKAIATL